MEQLQAGLPHRLHFVIRAQKSLTEREEDREIQHKAGLPQNTSLTQTHTHTQNSHARVRPHTRLPLLSHWRCLSQFFRKEGEKKEKEKQGPVQRLIAEK